MFEGTSASCRRMIGNGTRCSSQRCFVFLASHSMESWENLSFWHRLPHPPVAGSQQSQYKGRYQENRWCFQYKLGRQG
jgi:hypothetical protein